MLLLRRTAALFTAAVCMYAIAGLLYQSAASYSDPSANDPVSILERKLACPRGFVGNVTDIGYISEKDYQSARAREFQLRDVEHIGRYYVTQYALAPKRIHYSHDYPLVIAHFLEATDVDARTLLVKRSGLSLVNDCGDGVAVYNKR